MEAALHHLRLITPLLVVIVFARIDGSSLPLISNPQTQGQRHTRETETEVAHWSAQLRSSDDEKRREAVINLSRLDSEAAVSALASALSDASPSVRALALAALGERADQTIVSQVIARLTSDKDAFVRKAAAYALGKFSGPQRTDALIAALRDKDQEVRSAATVSLGHHPDASAMAALASALSDKSDFVRAHAARALGINGGGARQAVPALIRILRSDPDNEVKRQAATALGLIGDRSALPALEHVIHDRDSYLAQAARESIRLIEAK